MYRSIRAAAGLLAMAFIGTSTMVQSGSAEHPLIIAHRGASGYLPEHTLAAKALAYGQGADYLEQDVVLTKDGVPIVSHDVHLDTVTDVAKVYPARKRADGRYYALDFTWDELRRLNVHERIDLRTGEPVFPSRFPVAAGRFALHTLREELEMIQGLNRATGRSVGAYPEIKGPQWHRDQGADPSPIILQVLRDLGYDDPQANIFVQCFEPDELRRWRDQLGAKMKLVQLLTKEQAEKCGPEQWREMAQYAQAIGPSLDALMHKSDDAWRPTSLIREARQARLAIHPWTLRVDALPPFVETYEQLLELLVDDWRVEGFFTDFPDRRRRS